MGVMQRVQIRSKNRIRHTVWTSANGQTNDIGIRQCFVTITSQVINRAVIPIPFSKYDHEQANPNRRARKNDE
ncbi:hypothetical protein GZ77_06100 [Endozoicomonas montiporae]|uniref:Uncharacterized protein n=1 Tax=Endozoicomonas montiporae TaxID=1027273 RepID=A0A081NC62_9GAMM|nr:hypothetical protein GZ77_06100 [Endozoicomonas montiporae]